MSQNRYLVCWYYLLFHHWASSQELTVELFLKYINPASKFTYERHHTGPNLHLHNSSLHHNCRKLFLTALVTDNVTWPPPFEIPSHLYNSFTLDHAITVRSEYYAEKQNGGEGYNWMDSEIESLMKNKNTCGPYQVHPNISDCEVAILKHKQFIENKVGCVFGSQSPWAEAALIGAGALQVTTVEYMKIQTNHPKLVTIHPYDLATKYLDEKADKYDFAWSYSSFEHDGLGRYGDPLNPFADLESMTRVHCLLKPDGVFFLAVGVGQDRLYWNAHRIYGKLRLWLVLQNWELIDIIGAKEWYFHQENWRNQPILVLKKKAIHHHHEEES